MGWCYVPAARRLRHTHTCGWLPAHQKRLPTTRNLPTNQFWRAHWPEEAPKRWDRWNSGEAKVLLWKVVCILHQQCSPTPIMCNLDSVLINTATESVIQKLPIWWSSISPQPALTQTGLRASDRSWRAEQGRVSPNKERELLKHYSQLDARSDSDVHTTGQTYPQDYKRRHLRKTSSSIHRHLTVIGEITAAPNIILLLESQIFFSNIPKYSSHGIPNILRKSHFNLDNQVTEGQQGHERGRSPW